MDPAAPVQGAWPAAAPTQTTWRPAWPGQAALLPGPAAAVAGGTPLPDAAPAPGAARTGTTEATADRVAESPATRPADLDDPVSLDELADKVYRRFRRLLRGELLADHERAGLLGELG